MLYVVSLVLLIAVLIHSYRYYVLHKSNEANAMAPFDGDIYLLGNNVVAKRKLYGNPTKTVVCMPGFMETIAYYFDVYNDADVDLILVNNGFYHSPLEDDNAIRPAWYDDNNPYELGTIEHDAYVLVQVLRHLPSTDHIILHGHSRGGAVVLEAGRMLRMAGEPQEPQRYHAALLEAPVLPQGKARGHDAPLLIRIAIRYFMPLAFHQYRDNARLYLNFGGYKHPHTDVKAHILSQYFGNPKQYHITVTNIKNIDQWITHTDYSVFDSFSNVIALIPEKDIVLDRNAMLHSAMQSDNVKIKMAARTDHFISLERPELIRQTVQEFFPNMQQPNQIETAH